jgi:hypothetical protein
MDAYLRSVGIEMQTYSVNGERHVARDAFYGVIREVLVAHVRARDAEELAEGPGPRGRRR